MNSLEMNEIVNIFVNNGVAVAVIIYFMIRDYKFISSLSSTLQELIDTVKDLSNTVNKSIRKESE